VKAYRRCGGSSNKPFCDGTHRKNGFKAPQVGAKTSEQPIFLLATRKSREAKCTHHSNGIAMDEKTTITAIKKHVSNFRDERNWLNDNTPKNLAISVSVEAAELLEHFQWETDEQIREAIKDRAKKNQISDELADVLILCLGFSDVMGIDISEAIEAKLRKAAEKYPVIEQQTKS
jgi:NTP pyrophosphatase (non-canonical NTP hydrolase)